MPLLFVFSCRRQKLTRKQVEPKALPIIWESELFIALYCQYLAIKKVTDEKKMRDPQRGRELAINLIRLGLAWVFQLMVVSSCYEWQWVVMHCLHCRCVTVVGASETA